MSLTISLYYDKGHLPLAGHQQTQERPDPFPCVFSCLLFLLATEEIDGHELDSLARSLIIPPHFHDKSYLA
jgi:hypothetical protein